jgi:hypothetical protein
MAADRLELKDKPTTSTATNMHSSNSKPSFRVPTNNVAVPKRNLVIVPKSSNSSQVPNRVQPLTEGKVTVHFASVAPQNHFIFNISFSNYNLIYAFKFM